jgi:mannosyltransferase
MRGSRAAMDHPAPGPGPRFPNLGRRTRHLALLAALALGLLLRAYRIGSEGLWIDEAFSVWLARQPLTEMVGWVATVDQHPPLYYALLHAWVRVFGDGEAGVRMLSALCGTLTIPMVYLLGRRVADERVGLVGALILAVSPFHVRFSQEARMYAVLTLSAALVLYAFVALLDRAERGLVLRAPRSPLRGPDGAGRLCGSAADHGSAKSGERGTGRPETGCGTDGSGGGGTDGFWRRSLPWIGYVVGTAAALWTHNAAVLLPIALNLCVVSAFLIQRMSRRGLWSLSWLRKWVLAQGAILLLWLPWVPTFISQAAGVYRRFWLPAPTLGTVISVVSVLLCDSLPLPLPGIVAVDVALLGLALPGLRSLRRRPLGAAFLGATFLVPLAGEWLLSLWRPILYARTLIWTSIPLTVMLAAGICQARRALGSRAAFLLVLVAVLGANGAGVVNAHHSLEKEEWNRAAALVAERVRPDDLILFNDAWGQIPFDYYFGGLYNRPVTAHGVPVDLFDRGVLEPEMTEEDLPRLRELTQGRDRIWLVYSHAWYTDPRELVPLALEADMALLERWEFEGVRAFLYGR